jgi:OOP family OmpA-OmpF porin
MKNPLSLKKSYGFGITVAAFALLSVSAAMAQEATVQGLVIGRNGPMMYVKTNSSPRETVVLKDDTSSTEKGGFLGLSHKNLGPEALVPGLEVKVEGSYDSNHQLVAKKVEFSRSSLRTAKQIDAGLNPVSEEVEAEKDHEMADRRDIDSGQQTLDEHGQRLDAHGKLIAANGTAITATNGRIGELDQYDTKDSLTVNFRNGSAVVSQKDQDALSDFVKQAANTQGYMVQVQGYASKVGSPRLNQRLSSERADAVLAIIQQSGAVPMTRILAPAAMGVSDQLASNHTRSGQAQNRRVVVTILVNKGITAGAAPDNTAPAVAPAAGDSDAPSNAPSM